MAEIEFADGKFTVDRPEARGEVYLQGAHVTRWIPAAQRPVIFLSPNSAFAPGRAIRGGIPVVFPWFGPHPSDPQAPQHGYARTRPWLFAGAAGGALQFELAAEPFRLRYDVAFGATLALALTVENRSSQEAGFEAALHSYFAVSDVAAVAVEGLAGCTYLDKPDGMRRKLQAGDVTFAGETDRVYLDTPPQLAIHDPGWRRRIAIDKTGAAATIVWNPWRDKAAAMADLGAEAWRGLVCVETGNVADNAVRLAAGASHTMTTAIAVAAL